MAAPVGLDFVDLLSQFWDNFRHNLFKPLLLFFYMGFLVPLLRVPFEFPHVIYQGLTIYLLIAIGWKGGEELADLNAHDLAQAGGFMATGFVTNFAIGCLAYLLLRSVTKLRRVDAATVAGYYGSDSAGTFVTCVGVLASQGVAYAAYMPVMLAVMEIPGCLVALYLVSRLRRQGMDPLGNLPGETGYDPTGKRAAPLSSSSHGDAPVAVTADRGVRRGGFNWKLLHEVFLNPGLYLLFGGIVIGYASQLQRNPDDVAVIELADDGSTADAVLIKTGEHLPQPAADEDGVHHPIGDRQSVSDQDGRNAAPVRTASHTTASQSTNGHALVSYGAADEPDGEASMEAEVTPTSVAKDPRMLVLPLQKKKELTAPEHVRLRQKSSFEQLDALFVDLFQGALCLFLLEMGMTACKRLRDLKAGGLPFVAFGLIAPNVFAACGMLIAHGYSHLIGQPFAEGTYVLFAVLCAAASYIAVPAVQRMAIPEASPTLPLAASLGLTFSYNVTIGIPVYMMIAKILSQYAPPV